jgi:NADH dehydrogenase
VGNLMGSLLGKGFFIEGAIARLMYRSLYKMHERALHGTAATLASTLGRGLRRRPHPLVKLH